VIFLCVGVFSRLLSSLRGGVDPVGFCGFKPTASWLVLCFGLSVLLALLCVFCGFVGLFGALCGLVCVRSCLCLRGVFNLAWRVTEGHILVGQAGAPSHMAACAAQPLPQKESQEDSETLCPPARAASSREDL
jgi:hypothetical protein